MDFLIQQIVHKLKCSVNIGAAGGNGHAAGIVQGIGVGVPAVFHSFVNGQAQRNVVAALLVQTLLFENIIDIVREVPPLVAHAQHSAGGKLGDVFIVGLGGEFYVHVAFLVFFVQFLEIPLGSRRGIVVNHLHRILVYNDRAVVGIPIKELGCILDAEIAPVFAKCRVGNVLGTVCHGGVGIGIAFQQIEILVQGFDFGVTGPFQNTRLNPEGFIVMGGGTIFAIGVLEYVGPIDFAVLLAEVVPLFVGVHLFQVGILFQVIIPRHQDACIVKRHHGIAAIDEVRILTARDDCADGFCVGLAGQPGLFQFGTGLFGNDVHNVVVIIDFGTGHCGKHRKCFDPIGRFGGIRAATCR